MRNLLQSLQPLLLALPKIDTLLQNERLKHFNKSRLKPIVREKVRDLRERILRGEMCENSLESALDSLIEDILNDFQAIESSDLAIGLKKVINATGVVVQTNLGRSVFSSEILEEISPYLQSYHTLEYDLERGKRGSRYTHSTQILREMFGVEDALLVNNNAAAVLLVLNTFAKDREVIISRGELVEIGGGFRIPEVMKNAGAILREVGTTNKTRLEDYKEAINETSAMIFKAHQSNFTMSGFVEGCKMGALSHLAKSAGLIDYYDLGSAHLGLFASGEASLYEILRHKPSLISFSGDKLLGAPQCGIILGQSALIQKLKNNQLLRALRVDKFTILALNATLKAYQNKEYDKIPTLAMLRAETKTLQDKAQRLLAMIEKAIESKKLQKYIKCEMISLTSLAGGGSLPNEKFSSYGIALQPLKRDIKDLESALRLKGLIASMSKDKILLDVRTIFESQFQQTAQILVSALEESK